MRSRRPTPTSSLSSGWVLPAYALSAGAEEITVLRVVCREDLSPGLAATLARHLLSSVDKLEAAAERSAERGAAQRATAAWRSAANQAAATARAEGDGVGDGVGAAQGAGPAKHGGVC